MGLDYMAALAQLEALESSASPSVQAGTSQHRAHSTVDKPVVAEPPARQASSSHHNMHSSSKQDDPPPAEEPTNTVIGEEAGSASGSRKPPDRHASMSALPQQSAGTSTDAGGSAATSHPSSKRTVSQSAIPYSGAASPSGTGPGQASGNVWVGSSSTPGGAATTSQPNSPGRLPPAYSTGEVSISNSTMSSFTSNQEAGRGTGPRQQNPVRQNPSRLSLMSAGSRYTGMGLPMSQDLIDPSRSMDSRSAAMQSTSISTMSFQKTVESLVMQDTELYRRVCTVCVCTLFVTALCVCVWVGRDGEHWAVHVVVGVGWVYNAMLCAVVLCVCWW